VPTSNPVHGLHCTVMLGLGLGFVDLIRFFSTSASLAADLVVHQTVDLSGVPHLVSSISPSYCTRKVDLVWETCHVGYCLTL
jgi:hypothetical protein